MLKRDQIQLEIQKILQVLATENRYMTPAEILRASGLDLKPHVLRDRLKSLVNDGKAEREGKAKGTKYRFKQDPTGAIRMVLPKVTMQAQGEVTIPLPEPAKKTQQYVQAPLTARHSVGYRRSFLDGYRPNTSSYLTTQEREELAEIGKIEDQPQPAGSYARKILNRLLIDLSFNSSRLEGNTYSLLDTERLIEDGVPASGKDPQETQMILNHKSAIEFLVDTPDTALDRFTICNLHALLSDNLLGNPAAQGRLRTIAVDMGQSAYLPTAIPQLIEECFGLILEKARQISDPFERALFVSIQIPYLQPFEDVNKRVSRLAANIPLFAENLCPLSFTDLPKKTYIEGLLGVYELNDVSLFKEVFKWAYRRSVSKYKVIQESLGMPDPLYLRHRELIKQTVKAVVEKRVHKSDVSEILRGTLRGRVNSAEELELIHLIERELTSLHEGNVARFRIDLANFRAWSAMWQ